VRDGLTVPIRYMCDIQAPFSAKKYPIRNAEPGFYTLNDFIKTYTTRLRSGGLRGAGLALPQKDLKVSHQK